MLAPRRASPRSRRKCAAFSMGLVLGALVLTVGVLSFARAESNEYTPLLRGKIPTRSAGVLRSNVLSDGQAADDGAHWKTRLTAVFEDVGSSVEFDLGAVQRVRGAWLQGDNNDSYRVEVSTDGRTFSPLWDAPPVRHVGLRARETQGLDRDARFVRIRPLHGDGNFSLSEVELFSGTGSELPSPEVERGVPLSDRLRDKTLLFGLSLLALLLVPARPRLLLLALGLAVAAIGGVRFVQGVRDAWPAEAREVSLIRGMIAFVGAAVVLRDVFSPPRWPASKVVCAGVLATCAALGIASFYNFGHPQFWNEHQGRWSFAHSWDLRQYYPTAKYFRELSYFRIYDADVAAYVEQRPDHALGELVDLPVRDLETFDVVRVADRSAEIASIRTRFSPERWAAYRADADWFRRTMGDASYLDTLLDYGGNATPVWMAIAHVLFSVIEPSDRAFFWTGLIDLALLLAAFIAIGRTFGPRTMLVSMLVFGANDFVMYGTNWAGATLRHDWLAYLAFGLCALRRERWMLAGAWLGLATMIRAFPLLAIVGAALPAIWRTVEAVVRTRAWPRFSQLQLEERAILRVALGALVAAAIGAGLSALILGPSAWTEWWAKVAKIESDPHPACVALRNLIAGSDDQARIMRARWPLYAAAIAVYSAVVVWLSRNASLERAAILGLCLVPVVLYPANYYLHFVYLWPLLAVERAGEPRVVSARDAWVWVIALAMCAVQYFTTLEHDIPLHFYLSTVTLFAALSAMLGVLLASDVDLRAWLSRRAPE